VAVDPPDALGFQCCADVDAQSKNVSLNPGDLGSSPSVSTAMSTSFDISAFVLGDLRLATSRR
jgi:hypothetical protein